MLKYCRHISRGSGQRAGGGIPKQFKKINDKTILNTALKINSIQPLLIDEITAVIHPEWRQECEHILSDCRISKVKHLLDGGKERYHSVLAALKFYAGRPCNLLIHDAVRPLVSPENNRGRSSPNFKLIKLSMWLFPPQIQSISKSIPLHAYVSRIPTEYFVPRYKLLKDFTTKLYKKLMPWH